MMSEETFILLTRPDGKKVRVRPSSINSYERDDLRPPYTRMVIAGIPRTVTENCCYIDAVICAGVGFVPEPEPEPSTS